MEIYSTSFTTLFIFFLSQCKLKRNHLQKLSFNQKSVIKINKINVGKMKRMKNLNQKIKKRMSIPNDMLIMKHKETLNNNNKSNRKKLRFFYHI